MQFHVCTLLRTRVAHEHSSAIRPCAGMYDDTEQEGDPSRCLSS